MWNELKSNAIKQAPLGYYENREQAARLLLESWDKIPQSLIDKACTKGMRGRLERCIFNRGSYAGRKRSEQNPPMNP